MLKPRITIALFLILFLVPSLSSGKMLSVSGEDVNLRSGPGKNYSVKWKYGKGSPVKVLQKKGSWYKIEDFEKDIGWLHESLTSSAGHLVVKVHKGNNKKINIRSGPGTTYAIVGKAYYGVVFKTVKQQKGWAKVKHESGVVGWVKRSLLWGF